VARARNIVRSGVIAEQQRYRIPGGDVHQEKNEKGDADDDRNGPNNSASERVHGSGPLMWVTGTKIRRFAADHLAE
jgi:hypothetical protein